MPITQQLQLGSKGEEVRQLQKFLNSQGYLVSDSGPGSPGEESDYFGPKTEAAVKMFQAGQGIVSSGTAQATGYGRVGPKTLTAINSLLTGENLPVSQEGEGMSGQYFQTGQGVVWRSPEGREFSYGSINLPSADSKNFVNTGNNSIGPFNTPFEAEDYAKSQGIQSYGITPYSIATPQQGNVMAVDQTTPESFAFDGGGYDSTGNALLDEAIKGIKNLLKNLQSKDQIVNPNIPITEERLAEFTKIAENEIDPYYSTQLKLARESLLKDIGYSTEDILRQEQDLEIKYGKAVRQIGEQAFETGFGYSGRRLQSEQELAQETQRQIDESRRTLSLDAEKAGREFAQLYGGQQFQVPTIQQAPRALAGEYSFQKPQGTEPLYQLSSDLYDSLVGSKQYEQEEEKRRKIAEQKQLFKEEGVIGQERQFES